MSNNFTTELTEVTEAFLISFLVLPWCMPHRTTAFKKAASPNNQLSFAKTLRVSKRLILPADGGPLGGQNVHSAASRNQNLSRELREWAARNYCNVGNSVRPIRVIRAIRGKKIFAKIQETRH